MSRWNYVGTPGETKQCSKCGEIKSLSSFYKHKHGLRGECRSCHNRGVRERERQNPEARRSYNAAAQKRAADRRRALALEILGNKCVRCGFDDPRALQIDHVEGGGLAEIARITHRGVVKRVIAGTSGYQLLCANCNWIKRAENGEVAGRHQRGGD